MLTLRRSPQSWVGTERKEMRKLQPASCIIPQAILPIHLIHPGSRDSEIDKNFIGFQHGKPVTIRVRRPLEHEYLKGMVVIVPKYLPSGYLYMGIHYTESIWNRT